ncbi:Metallo-peptidase family M12-domain-containing protein [Cladochytrium replicatum]|nr:Metallo-peptidase family M12-domain-containing protein [Cladochytrium replicatum]
MRRMRLISVALLLVGIILSVQRSEASNSQLIESQGRVIRARSNRYARSAATHAFRRGVSGDINDDIYVLSLSAFGRSFHLLLKKAVGIVHPGAKITVIAGDDETTATSKVVIDGSLQLMHGVVVEVADDFGAMHVAAHDQLETLKLGVSKGDLSRMFGFGATVSGSASVVIHEPVEMWSNWREEPDKPSHVLFEGNFETSDESFSIDLRSFEDIDPPYLSHPKRVPRNPIWKNAATVITRRSDQNDASGGCSSDTASFWVERKSTIKGKLIAQSSTGPGQCPQTRKVVYVSVVADCNFMNMMKSDVAAARNRTLAVWTTISSLYESSFNITLGLANLTLLTQCDSAGARPFNVPCSSQYSILNRLSDFSKWRGDQVDNSALYHLISGDTCGTGATVGVAWLNTLCIQSTTSQTMSDGTYYVSGTSVSAGKVADMHKVIAHEIGHNFGAVHDCASSNACSSTCNSSNTPDLSSSTQPCDCCSCTNSSSIGASTCSCAGQYLMHPTESSANFQFSPCSKTLVCNAVKNFPNCLKEPGTFSVASDPICGNGILEGDEECDCGPAQSCNDACCNASACKLAPNAVCSPANHACCTPQCTIVPVSAQKVCRMSSDSCDLPEICDGSSKNCPKDVILANGAACSGITKGKCASGKCTTRTAQCRALRSTVEITGDCPDTRTSCELICASSDGNCIKRNGYFVDGTSSYEWCIEHKEITIVILVAVGAILFGILFSCFCRCARRSTKT